VLYSVVLESSLANFHALKMILIVVELLVRILLAVVGCYTSTCRQVLGGIVVPFHLRIPSDWLLRLLVSKGKYQDFGYFVFGSRPCQACVLWCLG